MRMVLVDERRPGKTLYFWILGKMSKIHCMPVGAPTCSRRPVCGSGVTSVYLRLGSYYAPTRYQVERVQKCIPARHTTRLTLALIGGSYRGSYR